MRVVEPVGTLQNAVSLRFRHEGRSACARIPVVIAEVVKTRVGHRSPQPRLLNGNAILRYRPRGTARVATPEAGNKSIRFVVVDAPVKLATTDEWLRGITSSRLSWPQSTHPRVARSPGSGLTSASQPALSRSKGIVTPGLPRAALAFLDLGVVARHEAALASVNYNHFGAQSTVTCRNPAFLL